MKIIDKNLNNIKSNKELYSKFISAQNNNLGFDCNILNTNFYLDTHNYFPLTFEYFTFFELFSWGEKSKYNIFFSDDFLENFKNNSGKFDSIDNVQILGSSSNDNYYRNIITFLPRLFFFQNKELKLAIHRKSSNKFRNFIRDICEKMNIKIQFVFLDDNFYKFSNSQLPQFLNLHDSVKILNHLKIKNENPQDKIFVTRQNASYRNLVNESDLIQQLKPLGFRVVDLNNFDIFEQIDIFSNSKYIISPTGSALANIVFCNAGSTIIEITPQYNFDYEDYFKLRYKSIAELLNLKHIYIEADSVSIDKIEKNIESKISTKILNESNYYKNLILKLEKIQVIKDLNN